MKNLLTFPLIVGLMLGYVLIEVSFTSPSSALFWFGFSFILCVWLALGKNVDVVFGVEKDRYHTLLDAFLGTYVMTMGTIGVFALVSILMIDQWLIPGRSATRILVAMFGLFYLSDQFENSYLWSRFCKLNVFAAKKIRTWYKREE